MTESNVTLSNSEKLGLISNLSTMITAGISLVEAIDSLLEDAKGNQKKILDQVMDDLSQGKLLHVSLAKFPKVFDKVFVNIIKAAEEAGTLDVTLKDLKEIVKKDIEFTDKVKSSLTYPVLILVVFSGVFILLLTFVIPRISTVFLRLKVDLPLPTQILIFLSNAVLTYTIPIIIVFGMIVAVLIFVWKTNKKILYGFLFSLPLISDLVKQIDLTRLTRSLYLLLTSGIPLISALDLAEDVVNKKEVAQVIAHSKEVALSGKKLSEAFKDHKKTIPSIMIKITDVGERTGTLDKSMQDISEYLSYQVTTRLQAITTLLEPIMLVVVGVMIGAMMLSIIAPIYGLIGQVGAR